MNYDPGQLHSTPPPSAFLNSGEFKRLLTLGRRLFVQMKQRATWVFIACVACMVLSVTYRLIQGGNYTAEVLLQPYLAGSELTAKTTSTAAPLDAGYLLDGQIQLLQSQTVARAAIQRLGIDNSVRKGILTRLLEAVGYVPDAAEALDRDATMLLRKLIVTRQRPSYLIRIAYAAPTADEANRMVNAVAGEYIRQQRLQIRRERISLAQSALTEYTRRYGDRHPLVERARHEVSMAQSDLLTEENSLTNSGVDLTTASVVAQQITVPGNGLVMAVLLGLSGGLLLSTLVAGLVSSGYAKRKWKPQ
jgi:hypothetical protein